MFLVGFFFLQSKYSLLLILSIAALGDSHGGGHTICPERCPFNPPYLKVNISSDSTYRYVTTYQCPPYRNPEWTNPAQACVQEVTYRIPLQPKLAKVDIPTAKTAQIYNNVRYLAEDPSPIMSALGVLVNGVNLYGVGSPCGFSAPCPPTGPTKYVDAVDAEGHTTDQCGGHAAPSGHYHIHSGLKIHGAINRTTCSLPVDSNGEHSKLLGWAFDGFGVYGEFSENGAVPTDLDACSGHTHYIDGTSIYHYHLPHVDKYPWTIGCFKGCPEVSNSPRQLQFTRTDAQYGCKA